MLQIATLTPEELATLPDSGKTKKDKLLQLLKSRNFDPKIPAGRPAEPLKYRINGDYLNVSGLLRGKINLKEDDVKTLVLKLTELIDKIKGVQAGGDNNL